MINYIKADIYRIMKKKSLKITLGLYILLFLTIIFILYTNSFTGQDYLSKTITIIGFYPLVVGLGIFISIYFDNFRSKSIHVAIGHGVPKRKIVICYFVTTVFVTLLLTIIFSLFIIVIPSIIKIPLTNAIVSKLLLNIFMQFLRIIGYASIASILIFFTQNGMLGVVVYVLLSSSTVLMILTVILSQEFFVTTFGDLTQYLFTNTLNNIIITLSSDGLKMIVATSYFVISLIVSMFAFRKKELEF